MNKPQVPQNGFKTRFPGGKNFHRSAATADGTGNEDTLLAPSGIRNLYSWSPDGKYLMYAEVDARNKSGLWVLPLSGDRKPSVYVNSEYNETQGQFSPDGHWVAYVPDETGR